MSRLNFLTKYATDGLHYDLNTELDKTLTIGSDFNAWEAIIDKRTRHFITPKHMIMASNAHPHSIQIHHAIARHPNVTTEVLDKIIASPSTTSFYAASSPKLNRQQQEHLFNLNQEVIDSMLADNPAVHTDILDKLLIRHRHHAYIPDVIHRNKASRMTL